MKQKLIEVAIGLALFGLLYLVVELWPSKQWAWTIYG